MTNLNAKIRTFLVANKDTLFDRTTRLIHIGEAATQFCAENGIVITEEIVLMVGRETHFVRAIGLV